MNNRIDPTSAFLKAIMLCLLVLSLIVLGLTGILMLVYYN